MTYGCAHNYNTHFPPGYVVSHTVGLRLLRVAAAARDRSGPEAVGRFSAAAGGRIFDSVPSPEQQESDGGYRGTREFVKSILADADLPDDLAGALDDEAFDAQIRRETDQALALTGKDVGGIMESHFRYEERRLLGTLAALELDADPVTLLGPL